MVSKINSLQKRINISLFLKNSFCSRNLFLIVFFMFIALATLTTFAGAEIGFIESTQEAGLTYTGPSWGATWADYNGDGYPDILVTNHEALEPSLYLNKGNGTFEDITDSFWDYSLGHQDTHGAAWADFDNDGDQDVLICANKQKHPFYVNDNGILYERSEEYGLSYQANRGRGATWLDFDRDGDLDVYMDGYPKSGLNGPALFRQNGDGLFENINSQAGIEVEFSEFSILSDLTGDGIMDFIPYGNPYPSYVYDMTTFPFTDYRNELFPFYTGWTPDVAFADFNGDLLPDLYMTRVAGEEDAMLVTPNKLAANIVTVRCGCEKGITFKTNGGNIQILIGLKSSHIDTPILIGSSGHLPGDFPSDIDPDDPRIWGFWPRVPIYFELSPDDPRVHGIYTHNPGVDDGVYIGFDVGLNEWQIYSSNSIDEKYLFRVIIETDSSITEFNRIGFNPVVQPNDTLYLHNGSEFENMTPQSGINNTFMPGRSVVAGDFDNDMDLDVYVVNSFRVANAPNTLWENNGQGVFTEVTNAGGAEGTVLGAGDAVVTADYNRDGFLDLFIANGLYPPPFDHLGPIQLFKNQGNANHWLEIDLQGTLSNRDGIGARVFATAGGVPQLREQGGGMHRYSQNHTRIHFGLGQNTTIQLLEIHWPSGIIQTIENIPADQIIQIVEPSGGNCNSYGVPTYDPATEDGIFLWKEGNVWHLRAIAGASGSRSYTGSIVSDQPLISITPVSIEASDILNTSNPQEIIFDISMWGPWFDGFDFEFPADATVTFDVQTTGGDVTDLVFIGGDRCTIDQLPYQLPSNTPPDPNNCDPYGEPTYDPAAEDGIFLWKEGNVWHLRAVAGAVGSRSYTGSIVSDQPLISITPVSIEASDILNTSNPQEIIFDISMWGPWFDGFDFEFPADATVTFDVQTTGGDATDLVFIGGDRCTIDQLPLDISGL